MYLPQKQIDYINDLKVQAMMFGASIDWETLQLNFSKPVEILFWQKRYKEKRADSDFDEYMDIDRE